MRQKGGCYQLKLNKCLLLNHETKGRKVSIERLNSRDRKWLYQFIEEKGYFVSKYSVWRRTYIHICNLLICLVSNKVTTVLLRLSKLLAVIEHFWQFCGDFRCLHCYNWVALKSCSLEIMCNRNNCELEELIHWNTIIGVPRLHINISAIPMIWTYCWVSYLYKFIWMP